MPLPINYYINITSSVGAATQVPQRLIIPCLFDDNALIPSNGFVNFPNQNNGAANVAAYFGANSMEYARAVFAFGWISKSGNVVPSISFARWNSAACAPVIYGDPLNTATTVSAWTAVTSGSLDLTMGAYTFSMTGLNFSGVSTLAGVATIIQTAIQAESGGGSLWTAATVSYDATRGAFELVGGATGAAVISLTSGGAGDIGAMLGWESIAAIFGPGAALETPQAALQNLAAVNNNFGSFAFTATLSTPQITALAQANLAFNNTFLYSVPATTSTVSAIQTAIGLIGDCTTTLTAATAQYEEQIPMMIMAATNYNGLNQTQNYMFQQFDINPTVTTGALAAEYDNLGVNYYANTQQAGAIINLYQRGVMNGTSSQPTSQNTYANEVWLKGQLQSSLFGLLLALPKIPANNTGIAMVTASLQSSIQLALTNGTISVGRILTQQQQAYITNATGQNNAWQQVQNIGYWLGVSLTSQIIDGKTQFIINYILIYAQDDVVNMIEGDDILI